jgi:ubiquinone/menaquinone biosynthesis C-methylase UbiE
MSDLEYGQQRQMEDPSMIGTLRTQTEMIWPLERPLLERLGLGEASELADLGCGTGEFAGRVAARWPHLEITGLDMFEGHLELARAAHPGCTFVRGDARATDFEADRFDVVSVRHVLHALPEPDAVLAEARRILRPDGLLYVLAEDYAGLIFDTPGEEAQQLFFDAAAGLAPHGTNLFHGRAVLRELRAAGFRDVRVDPIVIDTSNTPREVFAEMLGFWRDGYASFIAESLGLEAAAIEKRFESLRYTVLDEDRYACWLLFAASGRA